MAVLGLGGLADPVRDSRGVSASGVCMAVFVVFGRRSLVSS